MKYHPSDAKIFTNLATFGYHFCRTVQQLNVTLKCPDYDYIAS